jgi:hypothetical protein
MTSWHPTHTPPEEGALLRVESVEDFGDMDAARYGSVSHFSGPMPPYNGARREPKCYGSQHAGTSGRSTLRFGMRRRGRWLIEVEALAVGGGSRLRIWVRLKVLRV